MKELRLNQERLGRHLGISQPMVAALLNGTHHLSLDRAKELGKLLDLDPVIILVTHYLEHRKDLGQGLEAYSALLALKPAWDELWRESLKKIEELRSVQSIENS